MTLPFILPLKAVAAAAFISIGTASNESTCSKEERDLVFHRAQDDSFEKADKQCYNQGGAKFIEGDCVGIEENQHQREGKTCTRMQYICLGQFSCLN